MKVKDCFKIVISEDGQEDVNQYTNQGRLFDGYIKATGFCRRYNRDNTGKTALQVYVCQKGDPLLDIVYT